MADVNKVERIYTIDGLRGLCAVGVMIYHYLFWNGVDFFQLGSFGVYLFFVISGFSLWYVYAADSAEFSSKQLKQFYIARFARIFPLYCLICVLTMGLPYDLAVATKYLLNLSFLFGTSQPIMNSGVFAGWTVGIEWVFYILFPFLWIFLRNLKVVTAVLLFSIILNQSYIEVLFAEQYSKAFYTMLAQAEGVFRTETGKMPKYATFIVQYVNFPVFLVYFLAGIAVAQMYLKCRVLKLTGKRNSLFYLLCIITLVTFILCYPSETLENYLSGWHYPFLILACMGIIFIAANLNSFSGKNVKVVCKFLGDISFSTYLFHYYVYKHMNPIMIKTLPEAGRAVHIVIICVIVGLLAYMVHRFYEMPLRRVINRRFGQI